MKIRKKEVSYEFELITVMRQIHFKELELQQTSPVAPSFSFHAPPFDVEKNVNFIPSLGDRDMDKYLSLSLSVLQRCDSGL